MAEVDNRGPEIEAVSIGFLVLTWVVILLRCYARLFKSKAFFLDDYLIVLCLFLFTVYCGYGISGVHWGVGKHIKDVSPPDIKAAMKVWLFCEIFYVITSALVRYTAGVFLLRFAVRRTHKYIIYAMNSIGVVFHTIYLATIVFQCVPISYFWDRFADLTGQGGKCFDPQVGVKMTLAASVVAAVTDWTFGLLPIWIFWNAHLTKQKKIVICFLLGLAAFASAAPIVRLPYIAGLLEEEDFLYATTEVAIWSLVELGVAIVVISLHALRPLFVGIPFFALISRNYGSSNDNSKNASDHSGGSMADKMGSTAKFPARIEHRTELKQTYYQTGDSLSSQNGKDYP